MSAPQNTLTIEYLDAQGQLQRTEQLQGTHFTLRVQNDALSVVGSEASFEAASAPPYDQAPFAIQSMQASAPPSFAKLWQRITPWGSALILFGIFAMLSALEIWIEYNPDDSAKNYVTFALGITGAIAFWAAFWALLGKIFAKHTYFWQHVSIVLIAGIVLTVLMAAMHFLSFSLSWRMLGRIDKLSLVAALCLLVWAHLRLVVPMQRSAALRAGMIVFTLASVALVMWANHRRQGTVLDTFHSAHLYRPSLQLSSPQSAQAFFEKAKDLEATLKAKAGETEPGEDGIGADED
jgi:hypothetical protein